MIRFYIALLASILACTAQADIVSEKDDVTGKQVVHWLVTVKVETIDDAKDTSPTGKWARSGQGGIEYVDKWEWPYLPPDLVDLTSVTNAIAWAEDQDTEKKSLLDNMSIENKATAKILFDILNLVRTNHGDSALSKAQFEGAVLKPAIEWAKDN
jgi:hypothetical protein